jgi:uncharacterized damage-inducible protein DinB
MEACKMPADIGGPTQESGRIHRILARNAALANARLSRACLQLQPGEWEAPRISFFPSLRLTVLHLLDAERYYAETILRGALSDLPATRESVDDFVAERTAVDIWYLEFCAALTSKMLQRRVSVRWPELSFNEPLGDLLIHIFLHGQHHRSQIHAMLSGTSVPPPQIDEFILPAGRDQADAEMAALGCSAHAFGI